ncbi:MBL fold metallo-hydrolase [Putridiphycobacter roseus]|nr:MBL fold metallo-hydrolase [Putridiphycobacter roseus]
MKKIKIISSTLFVIVISCFIPSCSSTIDISNYPSPSFTKETKPLNNEVAFSLSIIETGYAQTREAFVYEGGSLFKKRRLSHVSILIQHPKGTFVFDTGLGSEIEGQFHDNFSFLDRQFFKFTKTSSLRETLTKNEFNPDDVDFIIPTHLHYDHAGGIEDFPKAEVWTTKAEYDHAFDEAASSSAFIKSQYDADFIQWKFMDFDSIPYEIFQESYDVFKDGTVVLVKLPGHTKGSIGMFVNLQSGKRYFFTGDLTWAVEAFSSLSEKHAVPRKKVDGDREQVKETIVMMHHLMQEKPTLHIVPAHDYNAQKNIARFPEVEW